jgi:hypothetical protein
MGSARIRLFTPGKTNQAFSYVIADEHDTSGVESAPHPPETGAKWLTDVITINWQDPKPKLKLVDKSALPAFAAVRVAGQMQIGEFRNYSLVMNAGNFRIAEQKDFQYWGGGECPVPEGLVVEVVRRNKFVGRHEGKMCIWDHDHRTDKDIIAYRIIGLADGWTDDPALA